MKKTRNLNPALLAACAALVFSASNRAAESGPSQSPPEGGVPGVIQGGDRWVALGDSITHSGYYAHNLETFFTTRYPGSGIRMFNAGIGGDTAERALSRLEWDILLDQPTVVSIMFGMNDVGRTLYEGKNVDAVDNPERAEKIQSFKDHMRKLVERIQASGARVVLITPSPTDDTMESTPPVRASANVGLAQCAAFVRELGRELDLPVIDFHAPMMELNAALQEADPTATLISSDRVHPREVGHLVMTHLFLDQTVGAVPVSEVRLDVQDPGATKTLNAEISGLEAASDRVQFELLEAALPFPIPEGADPALEVVPFMETLNRQWLEITGLKPGTYALQIDGESVASLSNEELASGINLATLDNTPQMQQAREVAAILIEKREIDILLSNIAFCELRLWSDPDRRPTAEGMAPLLESALAREAKKSDPRRPVVKRYKEYPKLKATEPELRAKSEELAQKAAALAVPKPHSILIQPAS